MRNSSLLNRLGYLALLASVLMLTAWGNALAAEPMATTCVECHEAEVKSYAGTPHDRAFTYGAKGDLQASNCGACHVSRSQHLENPGREFAPSAAQQTDICLQCHKGGKQIYWQSSAHKTAGVGCVGCHSVMEQKSEQSLLAAKDETTLCYTCHADVRGQMSKAYHHPVREGKMTCSDCHNVHGSVGKSLLKGATVNETCLSCHQEKRGPFVWEHAPVRENCANCHDSHGSNNRDLLNAKESFLCLQCHSYGGHINLPRYNRTSNPTAQGCVNCHTTQHGSNSPSGAKFTR